MRKLALLTTALFGLSIAPSFAQPSQSAPQTGLPPGAGIGAPNVTPPRASGQITTTTAPAAMPMADTSVPPPAPIRRRARRHRVVKHTVHHRAHAVAPVAPAAQ